MLLRLLVAYTAAHSSPLLGAFFTLIDMRMSSFHLS